MRKNRIVIVLLVLLIVVAGAVGAWVVTHPGDDNHSTVAGNDIAEEQPNPANEGNQPAYKPDGPAANTPAGGDTGNQKKPKDGSGHTPATNEKTNNKTPDNGAKTDKPDLPTDTEWVAHVTEATIHGRVTFKSDGRSAVGAAVSAEITHVNPGNPWSMTEVTDDNGRPAGEVKGDTVTDGAGEYTLKLSLKSWYPKGQQPADHSDPRGSSDRSGFSMAPNNIVVVATSTGYAPAKSQALGLKAGSDQEVNLQLAIPAAITGRVVDLLTRVGIAGARGQLSDLEGYNSGYRTVPRSFTTDSNGYFSLNALPAGNYLMLLKAKGYADYNGWRNNGRITLDGGEHDVGEIAMAPTAKVTGRVFDAESGESVKGASVSLRSNSRFGNFSEPSGETDTEGKFSFEAAPGNYSLRVSAKGYVDLDVDGVTIEAGKPIDLGDLKLGHGLTLRGIVTNADGLPLKDVKVKLLKPDESNPFLGNMQSPKTQATTNAQGRFEVQGVGTGNWSLVASCDKYATTRQEIEVSDPPKEIKIQLTRGGSIHGRLLDVKGAARPSAGVYATSQESSSYKMFKAQPLVMFGMLMAGAVANVSSNQDGTFNMEHVPAGTYVVFTIGPKSTPTWKDNVKVDEDGITEIGDLQPPKPGSAKITVTDDGAPVPDITVRLTSRMGVGGDEKLSAVTDAMGTATIENVPEGTWYVRTSRDNSQFDSEMDRRRVVIAAGRTTSFQLELRPKDGVNLHGRLTMNGKATFTDLILVGMGDRADVVKDGKPVEGGYYEFNGLKPGRYVLHAREGDKQVPTRSVLNLDKEGDFPFDYDFKGYRVAGTVTTPDNTPSQLAAVGVSIMYADPERAEMSAWLRGTTTVKADGSFEFLNVPPGNYIVSATLAGVGSVSQPLNVGNADAGLKLSVLANSGSLKVTVSKLDGTPVSGGAFAMVTVQKPDGSSLDLGQDANSGFMMLSEGASATLDTIPPGTYTIVVKGSGYLPREVAGVVVEKDKQTPVDVQLTAAAELNLTVTNTEVTQAMLDSAAVRFFNAQGDELPKPSNVFDSMTGNTEPPKKPTLAVKYIGPDVAEVRIKLQGYAELSVPVTFEKGKKIDRAETLQAE